MRLGTDVWVAALIRRAQLAGSAAVVARKGDISAGAVLVKAYDTLRRTARLYAERVGPDGASVWMQPVSGDEPALDAYAERAARIDPDLWVIEIEDRDGRHFLTEPVEG